MPRSYGRRVDEETRSLHARVSQAHDYDHVTTLWRRTVGTGTILCQLRRASTPAKRLVQLVAEYEEGGESVLQLVQVESPEEEAREALRLEGIMLAAMVKPTTTTEVKDAGPR